MTRSRVHGREGRRRRAAERRHVWEALGPVGQVRAAWQRGEALLARTVARRNGLDLHEIVEGIR